ncbi:GyrI-like domain-containing protein [Bacillus infantis]|uniref:GyrI-like domain-containing protein n=1 Tax=Bacillus infantis TaxID=324767 RepID=A0A5D4RIE4_9BACI|nr:GyrI-like domain-containing protein [Bacillus infantis]TYS51225.1 GyrI-like domain-containing protein [Bacillus infantis]
MGDRAVKNHFPIEDFHPQRTPQSLQVLLGQREKHQKSRTLQVNTVIIEEFKMLAIKVNGHMGNFEAGKEVRKAWKKLNHMISSNDSMIVEKNAGIVFYDQGNMVKSDGTIDLWVGVKVRNITHIPQDFRCFTIPKRKYAKIDCCCFSRAEMDRRYHYLSGWIKEEGYQIDHDADAFSLEPNRLDAFNPFDVPAHEIQAFDFDILYPIKKGRGKDE